MAPSHPWLAGPAPDVDLPRDLLEERILNLLASQNLAVVATVDRHGAPVATPVRYGSVGVEVVWSSWNASGKSRNLRRDSRASAGIAAPLVGPASSRGAQLFGTARTLGPDDPEHARYLGVLPWESDHAARGRPLDEPPTDPLTVLTPHRILYTEHWLRRGGYRHRQTWRAADG